MSYKTEGYMVPSRETAARRAYSQERYAEARAAGLCVRCRRESAKTDSIMCESCWGKQIWQVRKYKYGLTEEAFLQLIEEQDYRCAICLVDIETEPHVDHDHDTKAVRGLLCGSCNRGIGMFRDNVESLARAITYLKRER